jgi:hypothetical protein
MGRLVAGILACILIAPGSSSAQTDLFRANQTDLFRASPSTYAPRYDQLPTSDPRFVSYGGYFDPYYPYYPYRRGLEYVSALDRYSRAPNRRYQRPYGYVRLDVEPSTAEVYVDGEYKGTVDDFRNAHRQLSVGSHRIDVVESGYRRTSFTARVTPGETTTYRTNLARAGQSAPFRPVSTYVPYVQYHAYRAHAPAPKPQTFYVIPGCYAGDTQPREDKLPSGCNTSSVRTLPPFMTGR